MRQYSSSNRTGKRAGYVILPPIKVDYRVDHPVDFVVITPEELVKPQFLIDRLVERFHELPDLTPTEKALFEDKLKDPIRAHDSHVYSDDNADEDCWFDGPLANLPQEQAFVDRRKKSVQRGLVNLLKQDIEDGKFPTISLEDLVDPDLLPTIAYVSTGGGYRAMVDTTGFLEGAEETGILPCCMYMCGLSGSTWAINSLVASKLSVKEFADTLPEKIAKKDAPAEVDITRLQRMANTLETLKLLPKDSSEGLLNLLAALSTSESYKLCKFIQSRFGQDQGFPRLYGHALAEALLKDFEVNGKNSRHSIMMSDLQNSLVDTEPRYPLPLSVCLHSPEDTLHRDTCWFELSPYYVGTYGKRGTFSGWHIPTHKFGSYYEERLPVYQCPEIPLGQLYGIFGSAMAVSASTFDDYNKQQAKTALSFTKFLRNCGLLGSRMQFDQKRLTGG